MRLSRYCCPYGRRQGSRFPCAHVGSPLTGAIRRTPESAHHVVFHGRPSKNMRTQEICAATTQRRRALLDYLVGFHFVDRVRQGVSRGVPALRSQSREGWNRKRNATGENKFSDHSRLSRLTSVMASMTRAVPATSICHMRLTSRTPVRTGSSTNAR